MAQSHPDCGWIYQCDDLVVEPRAHRLERAGSPISVEPKAYAVLVVLLQQAGEVVDKDTLLDAAWGHRHVTPGVLTRVISHLRHALGDCASQPRYIATVHSLGYRFIGEVHRVPSSALPVDDEPLPDVASNDDSTLSAETPPPAPAQAPPPSSRWVAAAITLVLIVAVLAAVSLWHAPADAGRAPRVTPQPALAVMPVAREQEEVRPMRVRRWPHYRRVATQYPGDRDATPAELGAAGFLMLRPDQGPAANL